MNYVTTDYRTQNSKPDHNEAAIISNELRNKEDIPDAEAFLKLATEDRYSWCPAIFNGRRKNDNFQCANVVATDHDETGTVQEALDMLPEDLQPSLYYYTFSHTEECPKFRLVWLLDKVITSPEVFRATVKGLVKHFDADSTQDPARFYYPGLEGEVLREDRVSIQDLYTFSQSCIITNTSRERPRHIDKQKPFEAAQEEEVDSSKLREDLEKWKVREVKDKHWKKILHTSIVQEFIRGSRDFSHLDLFTLASNMYWIKGGMKFVKETMDRTNKWGQTTYNRNNYNLLRVIAKKRYLPESVKDSRFDDSFYCFPFHIFKSRGRVKKVKRVGANDAISLEEAQKVPYTFLNRVNSGVRLLKTPTALGKTEAALRSLRDHSNTVIGVPSHDLKNELSERLVEKEIEHKVTPPVPEFECEETQEKMQKLFDVGLVEEAVSVIYGVEDGSEAGTMDDKAKAKCYKRMTQEAHTTSLPVLTTHHKLMNSEFTNKKRCIFDEDPSDHLMNWSKIDLTEILNLSSRDAIKKLSDIAEHWQDEALAEEIKGMVHQIVDLKRGEVIESPDWGLDLIEFIDAILSSDIKSNIVEFLSAEKIRVDEDDPSIIEYLVDKGLPESEEVIIMSATPNEELYEQLFPGIEIKDVSKVEREGKLEQFTRKSYSKASIRESDDEELRNLTDGEIVITFKQFKDKFNNADEKTHYWNSSGFDHLKGKDLAIVGTPSKPKSYYTFLAETLGYELTEEDKKTAYRKVHWRNMEFKFYTFKSKKLQRLHFGDIESTLLQAIGRSRMLREDVTVSLYSNFPIYFADSFDNS